MCWWNGKLKAVCDLYCDRPPQPSTEAPPTDTTLSNSPGGSTNSLEVLSPLVKSCQEKAERSFVNELQRDAEVRLCDRHSTHLLKQSREASLDLMDKLLSLLLEQILTPANGSSQLNCLLAAATFPHHVINNISLLSANKGIKNHIGKYQKLQWCILSTWG